MNIDVTGHNIEITDALRGYAEQSVTRLKLHGDNVIQRIHIVLESSKNFCRCDLHVNTDADIFVAKDENDDMYIAIDRAVDKINKQVQSAKGKEISRRNR